MERRKVRGIVNEHYSREFQKQFISPIPPHLTPEEEAEWKAELEWEKQEYERRKAEGYYPHQD